MNRWSKHRSKPILFSLLLLSVLLALNLVSPAVSSAVESPQEEVRQQLEALTEEEKQVLENLFALSQDIEDLLRQQVELEIDLAAAEERVLVVEDEIKTQELLFENQRDVLGEVLKSYQRRGPGSTLEIILSARDFSDLIQRINLLRELTRNTGNLMDELNVKLEQLEVERIALQMLLETVEEQREALAKVLSENLALRDQLENRLEALEEERAQYEGQLASLNQAWRQVNLVFSQFATEFGRLAESGGLPQSAITLSFSLTGVRGTLREEALNQAFRDAAGIEGVYLRFRPGRILIEIPDSRFELYGTFDIKEGTILQFIPEEGTFYDIQLTDASLRELFLDGVLEMDLVPVLEGYTLRMVRVIDGALELYTRSPFLN